MSSQVERRQEKHLRNGKEARHLSSSGQELSEFVKKVRGAHLGNASVKGLKGPCLHIASMAYGCLQEVKSLIRFRSLFCHASINNNTYIP